MKHRNLIRALFTTLALLPACSGAPEDHEAIGDTSEAIINGNVVTTDKLGTAMLSFSDGTVGWGCSGTVIGGSWLLTAHHCVTYGNAETGGTVVNPANITVSILNGASTTGAAIFRHPTLDVSLVELTSGLMNPQTQTPFPAVLYPGTAASQIGTTLFCEGWGMNTFTSGFGTLRSASLRYTQMDGTDVRVVADASGQVEWHGDSGSSCFAQNQILGVTSNCFFSGTTVNYCDQVAVDSFYDWATAIMSARTFQATDTLDAVVLGTDGYLWYDHGPFGTGTPTRTLIDANALTFQTLPGVSVLSDIFVLGTDGSLWRESPNGELPPPRIGVDGSVRAFQALSTTTVFALGSDGKLWFETPNGSVPPPRTVVDASVRAFQAIDAYDAVVLGDDANLWLETGPWGSVPPNRFQIDGSVRAFQALDRGHVYVLGADGVLWLETPRAGTVPAPRTPVDANVASFQALGTSKVYVQGTDGKLWLETPNGSVPPPRAEVDADVAAFQQAGPTDVLTRGFDGNLWFENAPFGNPPPARQFIGGAVQP